MHPKCRLDLSVVTSHDSQSFVSNVKHFLNVFSTLVMRAKYQILNTGIPLSDLICKLALTSLAGAWGDPEYLTPNSRVLIYNMINSKTVDLIPT